jgi:acetyl esterase/lipase
MMNEHLKRNVSQRRIEMDKKRHNTLLVVLIMAPLLLAACGAPQPTSTPLPPTPTPIPPTATAGAAPETAPELIATEYSVIYKHIPYVPGGNVQQKLSVYPPIDVGSSPGTNNPVVVFMHEVDLGTDDPLLADTMRFVNQLGYAAVTIDYRDVDENWDPWTAHNDGACALAWIYANAATYGFDVDRMAAFGVGYGAVVLSDLALADDASVFLTECPNTLPITRPFRGVIPFGSAAFGVPGEGLNIPSQSAAELQVRHLYAADTVEEMMAIHEALAKLPPTEWAASDELSPEARAFAQTCPAYWVDSSDPPFLLLFPDENDRYFYWSQREYDAFARLLEEVGVPFTYVVLPGIDYLAWGPYGQTDQAAWQEPIQQFLESVFGE